MAIQPNLMVGFVGAVVLLLAGGYIVDHWRELTETDTYHTTIILQKRTLDERLGDLGSGASRTETYNVDAANLTQVLLRLTWEDHGLTGAQHEVTVTLKNPQDVRIAQETAVGGRAGITLEETILPIPESSQFDATSEAFLTRYEARYPTHSETQGPWDVQIETNAPSGVGQTSVSYRLSFEIQSYNVQVEKLQTIELTK